MNAPEPRYEVVWPLGKSHWDKRALSPGIGDLNGKTIGEVWDRVFRGEEIFPAIREALKKRFPCIRNRCWPTCRRSCAGMKSMP
jgi:hypothetical protein